MPRREASHVEERDHRASWAVAVGQSGDPGWGLVVTPASSRTKIPAAADGNRSPSVLGTFDPALPAGTHATAPTTQSFDEPDIDARC